MVAIESESVRPARHLPAMLRNAWRAGQPIPGNIGRFIRLSCNVYPNYFIAGGSLTTQGGSDAAADTGNQDSGHIRFPIIRTTHLNQTVRLI